MVLYEAMLKKGARMSGKKILRHQLRRSVTAASTVGMFEVPPSVVRF